MKSDYLVIWNIGPVGIITINILVTLVVGLQYYNRLIRCFRAADKWVYHKIMAKVGWFRSSKGVLGDYIMPL